MDRVGVCLSRDFVRPIRPRGGAAKARQGRNCFHCSCLRDSVESPKRACRLLKPFTSKVPRVKHVSNTDDRIDDSAAPHGEGTLSLERVPQLRLRASAHLACDPLATGVLGQRQEALRLLRLQVAGVEGAIAASRQGQASPHPAAAGNRRHVGSCCGCFDRGNCARQPPGRVQSRARDHSFGTGEHRQKPALVTDERVDRPPDGSKAAGCGRRRKAHKRGGIPPL